MLRSLILSSLVLFSLNVRAHDDHVHNENCHHHEDEIFDVEASRSYLPVSCQQDAEPSTQCIKDMGAVKWIHELLSKMDDAGVRNIEEEAIELTVHKYEQTLAIIRKVLEGSSPNFINAEDKCWVAFEGLAGYSLPSSFEVLQDFCHEKSKAIETSPSWMPALTPFNIVTGLSIGVLTLIAVNTRAKSAVAGLLVSIGIVGYAAVDTANGCGKCQASKNGGICQEKLLTWGPMFIGLGTSIYSLIYNTLNHCRRPHEH